MVGTEWAVGFFVRPSARERIVSLYPSFFFPPLFSFLPLLSPLLLLSSPLLSPFPHRFSLFLGSNLCPPVCFCPMTSRGKQMGGERMRGREKRFEITAGRKNLVNAREDVAAEERGEWRWNLEEEKRESEKTMPSPLSLFPSLGWISAKFVKETRIINFILWSSPLARNIIRNRRTCNEFRRTKLLQRSRYIPRIVTTSFLERKFRTSFLSSREAEAGWKSAGRFFHVTIVLRARRRKVGEKRKINRDSHVYRMGVKWNIDGPNFGPRAIGRWGIKWKTG